MWWRVLRQGRTPEDRRDIICLFINVAIEMYNLRNFAGLSSVITALCIDMVGRLKQTWARVPPAFSEQLQVRVAPHTCTHPRMFGCGS